MRKALPSNLPIKHWSKIAIVVVLWLSSYSSNGQKMDTTATPAFHFFDAPNRNPAKAAFWVPKIIPITLFAYGIASLHNSTLLQWNNQLQEEIWINHPHSKTTIDNYLLYSPALAVYGLNLCGVKGKNNFKDRTLIYGIATVASSVVVMAGKRISKEDRPDGSGNQTIPVEQS